MINRRVFNKRTAIISARLLIIFYAVMKQIFYYYIADGVCFFQRGIAGICMIFATFIITSRKNISDTMLAFLTSYSIAVIEIILCALIGGDRLIYVLLMGCSLVSLFFLDIKGMLLTLVASNVTIAFFVFVLRFPMLGLNFNVMDEFYWFFGLTMISIIMYIIGLYSVGSFAQFRITGQTFDTIMGTTPNHLVIINEKAHVEYISSSFANWLGISRPEYALNRPLLDLCKWGEMKMMMQEVMDTGGYVEENFHIRIDGQEYWFIVRSSQMGGGNISRVFELSDITPIMDAKNEAEQATRSKSNFLANMSHEIRTPLHAIIGFTELLAAKPLDTEQLEHTNAIKSSSLALLNIINDILDFSKIDADKMEIFIRPFDFSSLLNDTVNIINIKAQSQKIGFITRISKDIPPCIYSDELRLKQVLLNLLNNAFKFTHEGYVQLSSWVEPLDESMLKLYFSITDTGVGIKEEDMDKLFVEFMQVDSRRDRSIEGTGLGLAISSRLVSLMDGAISVESKYGVGSTFSFYIVCRGEHNGTLASVEKPEEYSVLCYEPLGYNADALEMMLQELGIPNVMTSKRADFEKELKSGKYEHIFYDYRAHQIIEKYVLPDVKTVLIKDMQDSVVPATASINRPILITSLARSLEGQTSAGFVGNNNETIKLGAFSTRNARVLLVDDNSVNLIVAEGLLRHYGIEVVTASGGKEGIDRARREDYDIIFMDHMMPDVDGIDATKIIRSYGGRLDQVPIVALSANAIAGMEEQFINAGMNGFLSKPISIKSLHNTILEFLPEEKVVWEVN